MPERKPFVASHKNRVHYRPDCRFPVVRPKGEYDTLEAALRDPPNLPAHRVQLPRPDGCQCRHLVGQGGHQRVELDHSQPPGAVALQAIVYNSHIYLRV